MRKTRWAATLMALGLAAGSATTRTAQTAVRPPLDAGPSLFPYYLPPPPLPPGTPGLVTVAPAAGPTLPAVPVTIVSPAAQPGPDRAGDARPPRGSPARPPAARVRRPDAPAHRPGPGYGGGPPGRGPGHRARPDARGADARHDGRQLADGRDARPPVRLTPADPDGRRDRGPAVHGRAGSDRPEAGRRRRQPDVHRQVEQRAQLRDPGQGLGDPPGRAGSSSSRCSGRSRSSSRPARRATAASRPPRPRAGAASAPWTTACSSAGSGCGRTGPGTGRSSTPLRWTSSSSISSPATTCGPGSRTCPSSAPSASASTRCRRDWSRSPATTT